MIFILVVHTRPIMLMHEREMLWEEYVRLDEVHIDG